MFHVCGLQCDATSLGASHGPRRLDSARRPTHEGKIRLNLMPLFFVPSFFFFPSRLFFSFVHLLVRFYMCSS